MLELPHASKKFTNLRKACIFSFFDLIEQLFSLNVVKIKAWTFNYPSVEQRWSSFHTMLIFFGVTTNFVGKIFLEQKKNGQKLMIIFAESVKKG